ncbi:hypothetical protein [Algoriphagus boritolerans]|uniref:GLPGLI family protein n=1 Tax=Algoriphagus boritolerans DSM 17298 = JCM 18970 TaxID=1120964 RepID=A0A1H5VJW7_9BACT|nr:hypothetical protein [Algoriphagus boritolerans]SEF87128.1 hypothetical protein SAMN03080598_01690 [Algoriphagus boritolerans DSM 17298 = JCM 18970]
MKKAIITLSFVFLGVIAVFAQNSQFPSQVWHKGNIYLNDGSTRSGLVKYDLDNNLVQLQNETIETFTASNVSNFEIFDEIFGGIRRFYSLPYAINGEYESPTFFEVLTEGNDLALLCREYVATDTRGMNYWGPMGMNPLWGPQNSFGYRLAFNYYFFKNGRLQRYSLKKKDLFALLPGYDDEIDLFMRKNRLEHDKRGDLLRITAYYNELKN